MKRRKRDIQFRAACAGTEMKDDDEFLNNEELMRRMDAMVAAQNGSK